MECRVLAAPPPPALAVWYTKAVSAASDPRPPRPWYLLASMVILWIGGVLFATRSCSEVAFLRGDEALRQNLDSQLATVSEPMLHTELVRQRAWLEATGTHHGRAFPVTAARLLLQLLLIVAAGAVITRRRGARSLALQAIAANAAFVIVAFAVMAPVREAAIEAVAQEVARPESPSHLLIEQLVPADKSEEEAVAILRAEYTNMEVGRAGVEISFYLLILLALTRKRARAYFAAIEAPVAHPEES